MKKLSSFANTFGGFLIVGVEANSTDGRIKALPGVDRQNNYKQTVVQWCFGGASPPLTVEVSDALPVPDSNGKVCYVIYTAESDTAPHFLNERKGVYVRTDEYSARFLEELANENELRYLLDRRRQTRERRTDLCQRSHRRFQQFVAKQVQTPVPVGSARPAPLLELSIGPRFPVRQVTTPTSLIEEFSECHVKWQAVQFPSYSDQFVSQHESVLRLAPYASRMVEANIWGMLFYGTALAIEKNSDQASSVGIGLNSLVGSLIAFVKHAEKMLSHWSYQGPISISASLSGILGIPFLHVLDGQLQEGPTSELDDSFSFSLATSSEELQKRIDAPIMGMMENILFAMNWPDYASNPGLMQALLISAYKRNFGVTPNTLLL